MDNSSDDIDIALSGEAHSRSTSSQHTDLLQTAVGLRQDLEQTIERIKSLESDNFKLTAQKSYLEDQLITFKGNYDEARKAYLKALTEKIDQEGKFEAFINKVKTQLSEKSKEFETLREKFAPQDIDFIRIKLQEEMELKQLEKSKASDAELEYYREQQGVSRRKLEKLAAEFETYVEIREKELLTLRQDHAVIERSLRKELSSARSNDDTAKLNDEIRRLNLQVSQLSSFNQALRVEAKTHQEQEQKTLFLLEESQSALAEAHTGHLAARSLTEAARLKAEQGNKHLSVENEEQKVLIYKLTKECESLQSQLDQLVKVSASKSTERDAALGSRHEGNSDILREELERTKAENRSLLSEGSRLNENILHLEDRLRRALKESSDIQLLAEGAETSLRKSFQGELQKARDRAAQLEIALASKQQESRALSNALNKLTEQAAIEREIFRSDMGRIQQEKGVLYHQLRARDSK